MADLLTTAEVAELFGCHRSAVEARMRAKGILPARERPRLWSRAQVDMLRPGPTGRPRRQTPGAVHGEPATARGEAGGAAHSLHATLPEDVQRRLGVFEQALSEFLSRFESFAPTVGRLHEAIAYSLLGGGKRLRAMLALECCVVCGIPSERAIPAAIAVECVHAFSLVHDDLPAMDNDDLRRGRPTTHRAFGEAEAILAGDWLLVGAFAALAGAPVSDGTRIRLVRTLASATQDMIAGQSADLAGEQKPPDGVLVEYIHRHKTAALIEAACVMGAICGEAGAPVVQFFGRFGRHLGLAFQITDDLLDVTGTEAALGKSVRKDATRRKQTYPAAFGLAEAQARAIAELRAAECVLTELGGVAEGLRALIRLVGVRTLAQQESE